MGKDPAELEQNPMRPKGGCLPRIQETGRGEEGRGNSSYTHAASQDSLGLSPEQMEVGFPNRSHCDSPKAVTTLGPWVGGLQSSQKTNPAPGELRQTGLTLLVVPTRNRQWSYFLPVMKMVAAGRLQSMTQRKGCALPSRPSDCRVRSPDQFHSCLCKTSPDGLWT